MTSEAVAEYGESKNLLSIVIPMYNSEQYIEACINSLLHQNISKNEFEIIVVNDGSKDGGPEIVKRMMLEHDNIVLISRENGGPSVARNTGIDNSRGEYIFFVDSDDYVAFNSFEKCMQYIKAPDNLDILFFEIKRTNRTYTK